MVAGSHMHDTEKTDVCECVYTPHAGLVHGGLRLTKEHYDISIASAEGFFVVWL